MTSSHSADTVHARACENCQTPLQGGFCHQCGQNAHNPLRSFGHAVEEVFESFWHLDGRIFRTLRALMSPGKLANAYLSGHRAPYVAPLRLFVILAVLTFFVAKLTLHAEDLANVQIAPPSPPVAADGKPTNLMAAPDRGGVDFSKAATVEDVLKLRDETIDGLVSARASLPAGLGFVRKPMEDNIFSTQRLARERIAELQPDHPALALPDRFPEGQPLPEVAAQPLISVGDKPFDAETNPVRLSGLPDFANRWLSRKLARAEQNIPRIQQDPSHFFNLLIGSVPSVLFVLVPLFAVLLKLFYIETRRGYLEHLVVALYSHAYLCLCLLAIFLCAGIGRLLPEGASWLVRMAQMLVFCWMPLYLLWMQQRVYRQHGVVTLVKFSVLGTVYFIMLVMGAMYLMLSTWANA